MNTDFFFQEWALLARTDPDAFESRRKQTIDQFLLQSSTRQRKMGLNLQREIDAERRRAEDPEKAFSAIAKMMWQQVNFLYDGLDNLSEYVKNNRNNGIATTGRMPAAPAPGHRSRNE